MRSVDCNTNVQTTDLWSTETGMTWHDRVVAISIELMPMARSSRAIIWQGVDHDLVAVTGFNTSRAFT